MTEYQAFSRMRTRLATAMAKAPPLPPSPRMRAMAGTLRRLMRWMLWAMTQAWPRSSAETPG